MHVFSMLEKEEDNHKDHNEGHQHEIQDSHELEAVLERFNAYDKREILY